MKNPNTKIARFAKIIFAVLLATAVSTNILFAQMSEQDYFKSQIAELTKQIAAAPKDDKLYVKRGELYLKLSVTDANKAFADADAALKINPKNQQAINLKNAASKLIVENDVNFSAFDYLLEETDKTPVVKPTPKPTASPTPKPSSSPVEKGSFDLTQRIAADPNSDQLYVERGNLYLKEKKFAEALADAEKALKLRASNDEALVLRGDIKAAKNDLTGAETDYKQAVKLRNETGIAAKIVSHSGKTLAGIVVKGKQLGNSDGYSSIDQIKKDWQIPLTNLKVIVKNKSGKFLVYEGIAVENSRENIKKASLADRPDFRDEPAIFTNFKYLKLAFDQSLFLPKKDKLTSRQENEIVDILDFSKLSVVRRQTFPMAAGNKVFLDLLEAEINSKHLDEAKEAYLNLEKVFKSASAADIKSLRIDSLAILYKAFEKDLTTFVEAEMTKYNFTPEEKKRVNRPVFYV